MVRVLFEDRDWRTANDGKAPRGFGSWAFSRARNPDVSEPGQVFWAHQMSFGDAKKAARAHFSAPPTNDPGCGGCGRCFWCKGTSKTTSHVVVWVLS